MPFIMFELYGGIMTIYHMHLITLTVLKQLQLSDFNWLREKGPSDICQVFLIVLIYSWEFEKLNVFGLPVCWKTSSCLPGTWIDTTPSNTVGTDKRGVWFECFTQNFQNKGLKHLFICLIYFEGPIRKGKKKICPPLQLEKQFP